MTTTIRLSAAAVSALLVLSACSGGDDGTAVDAAAQPTPTTAAATMATVSPAPSTTVAAPAPTSTTSPTSPPAVNKVSANNATVAELQRAFEAAGISNASRWAREVEEYRPYPSDPTWAKLRQELAKYNPGPGVVDQIIATLALP